MAKKSLHDRVAERLAKKFKGEYTPNKSYDIRTRKLTIRVEDPESVESAGDFFSGHRGPIYIACTNDEAVAIAMKRYGKSTIGIMDRHGRILKKSTRATHTKLPDWKL